MVASFLTMIPGPKMIWQMGELGYHYSINTCSNGSLNNNCRLDEKPVKWDYQNNTNRKKLYDVYAKLFAYRTNPAFSSSFINALISYNVSSPGFKQITVGDANLRTVVAGNFGVTVTTANISFPNTGTWYNLFNNTTISVTGTTLSMLLQPGDYYVFTSKNVNTILSINNTPNEVVVNSSISKIKMLVKPNPVNVNSIIEYELPNYGKLNINIIDMNGNTIANLVNEYKTKGGYALSLKKLFATKHLNNGLYFLQIDFNGKKQMEKLVIAN
jgi:hypothetical protein